MWWIGKDGYPYFGDNRLDDLPAPERPDDSYYWDITQDQWVLNPEILIPQFLIAIKTVQGDLGSNPLPLDLRKMVYDLARDLPVYLALNDLELVASIANEFGIDNNRIGDDVTQEQYDIVMATKTQMLALINSLQISA